MSLEGSEHAPRASVRVSHRLRCSRAGDWQCRSDLHAALDVAALWNNASRRSRESSMHDIRWIRDHAEAFDRALGAARACRRGATADRDRRAPARRHPEGRGGAGPPQRGIEGDRRGQEKQRGSDGAGAAGRGRAPEERDSGARGRGQRSSPRSSTTRSRKSPICRSTTCRTARTPTTTSSITISAPSATTASRPSSISSSAKRSGRWISRPRPSSRARASSS